MHSTSMRSAFFAIVERPISSCGSENGRLSAAVPSARRMKWFGTTPLVCSNHHADIWLSTLPLSGMPVGRMESNAEMRSVATISRRPSPRS